MTHIVGFLGNFAFGKQHNSAQVRTNGSTSASLNTQSQAKTISMSVFPQDSDNSWPSRFGIVDIKLDSQSKAKILTSLDAVGGLWTAEFPPRCLLSFEGLCFILFSAMLSFKVLKTYS